jgi:acyl-CoA thioester hydrolase
MSSEPRDPPGEAATAEAASHLRDFPVVVRLPIHWGEMDAFGHLNNVVYFRFFETARIHYFERCGFMATYQEDRVGAILHSTSCRFRRPLHFPDSVLVGTRVQALGEDRFTMAYRVVSVAQRAIAADGTGLIVSFDYVNRTKVPLPLAVRQAILAIEPDLGGKGADPY